jgi:DNA processing protein
MVGLSGEQREEERSYWALLNTVTGIGPARFHRLLEVCGSARAAWQATDGQLQAAGIDPRVARTLRTQRGKETPVSARQTLERLGLTLFTLLDETYPEPLRQVSDPPHVLYVKGAIDERDRYRVALVGTRRATSYGRSVAERLAGDLASAGITIVSGLAKGIDTYAHRAALDAGGRTIAVLGNGLDQVYPAENTGLARRIVEQEAGALLSEFAPGVRPDAPNFPRRNRIIAGLCDATVVVEAGRPSGALITADYALEQGRDVLAVPGSIFSPMSEGVHWLLKDGAGIVTGAQDVLNALGLERQPAEDAVARDLPALPEDERAVFAALGPEPRHADDVARLAGRPAAEVAATLTMLELRGLARHVGSMAYIRV